MLTTEKPAISVGGLLLFPDHADDGTWYYAAPNPHLAGSSSRPMFDLFGYTVDLKQSPLGGTTIPAELGAGFLTMGTSCALDTGTRETVLTLLSTQLDRDRDRLNLSPIPYTKGTVSVIALDAGSGSAAGAAGVPPPAGRPVFVERIIGGGPPSLLGDLQSIFSLSLSQDGVTFLRGLFDDGAAPVGVVYDLKFLALRPSVQATVHANVSKIYTEFGGKTGAGCAYFRADVEGTLQKLRQNGDIDVHLTSEAVGDEAKAAQELAMSLFRDKIIQELFNPTAAPDLSKLTVPGVPTQQQTSISWISLKALKDEELREIDYDFSLRAPEERTHAPQAFLSTLLSKEELAQHIHMVDLASPFFELLEVLVTGPSEAEFDALKLRSATVDLSYGVPGDPVPPETATLQFRPDGPTDLTWAVRRKGRRSLAYSYRIGYEFERDTTVDADALSYTTEQRIRAGRTLSVRPYQDLQVLQVEVENGRLPADVVGVDLTLDFADPSTGFRAHQDFRLPTDSVPPVEQRRWQVRTAGGPAPTYTASALLSFADPATFALPPVASGEPLFRVDAPFGAVRSLLIQPNVTSPDLRSITVEIEYADAAAKYQRRFVRTLTPTAAATGADGAAPAGGAAAPPAGSWLPVTLSWPIIAADRQELRYRVTTSAGGVVDTADWETTTDPSLLVGEIGSRSRTVDIRLIGPPLADAGIDGIAVRVGAAGSADGDAVSLFFDPTSPPAQAVSVPAAPGAPAGFRYQTTSFHADGSQRVSGWQAAPTNLIAISTRSI